jgi:tRNA-splicing ligase RtcB
MGLGERHHKSAISFDLKELVNKGVSYLMKKGYATQQDVDHTEEYGCLEGANFSKLSDTAIRRADKQLGTLGFGNHFIDIQIIEEIFDEALAKQWGLFQGQVCVMIHSGSRALGHQTCNDYLRIFTQVAPRYGVTFPNRELASLPLTTQEAQDYFAAMKACVNFAFCNRQMMTYSVRQVFKKLFSEDLFLLYDVAHNIGKWEEHHGEKVLVHRKGATRALPAGHPNNPKSYQDTGHPAIVPGSMGTASYVLVGLPKNAETYHSVNHGAGRRMSRTQAKRTIDQKEFDQVMAGIVTNNTLTRVRDEAPMVYKDIDDVVETLTEIDLTKKVVKLRPIAVLNGT